MFEALEWDEFERRLPLFAPAAGLLRTRQRFVASQAHIAKIADVSLRAYQSYERGEKTVPAPVLCRIAAFFELDLHELVTGQRSTPDPATIATLTDDAIRVAGQVFDQFKASDMSGKEARLIAAQVLKWKRSGEAADRDMIVAATHMVTGDKYVVQSRLDLDEEDE
ncbi:MAG: helix-turn-helix transcriptional regulator [Tabrizicola sp.]|nr:helix-turn-helix transcriptional regulator [Tabrizicola sp.]